MNAAHGTILALDVGGTTISSAALSSVLELLGGVHTIASDNGAAREDILHNIERAVSLAKARLADVQACAMAFPNPFDYEHGISHMEHKFQAIQGFNLRAWLEDRYNFPFLFLNDADAFGYGALAKVYKTTPECLVAITLGTGVGSTCFVRGALHELEIWSKPYQDGILEDAISTRAIAQRYRELTGKECSVKEQAERAVRGDAVARSVFQDFGKQLGDGLADAVGDLHPTAIIFGGAISQSAALFRLEAEAAYRAQVAQEVTFDWGHGEHMALYGSASYAHGSLIASAR